MQERVWTDKQKQSIEADGGSLLISAAAGSGKTAVLVERVMRLITDPVSPVDVNRLLIVTFTRAAAAEMRARLAGALAHKIADEPENPLYQRQQLLLPQAQISTIHGFCTAILREYGTDAGLPAGFRVAEETETALLSSQALDHVLEACYAAQDPAFAALAENIGGRRNDDALRQAVLQAHEFMQAQPFPQEWLREQIDAYTQVMPLEKTRWMRPILREIRFALEGCLTLAEQAVSIGAHEGLEAYRDALELDRAALAARLEALDGATYDEVYHGITSFGLTRLPPIRAKDAVIEEDKERVKALRDTVKKRMALLSGLFCGDEAACREDLMQLAPVAEALGNLVREYDRRFTRLKRQKKLLDYNDLEHESLKLLVDPESGERRALADELADRYEEIMVDEYQDTNAAQDALFRAVSRKESNLFMVGDVKQSIYGFRQAMPALFMARRDAYTPYDPESPAFPATITLESNFRSRSTVTDAVNFLFRQLMHRSLGGVEYDEREALVCAAPYEPAAGRETEWLMIDRAAEDKADASAALSAEALEARVIARRIRELMDTMTVTTRDGERPLEYGDICILLRSRGKSAVYANELNAAGIPTSTDAAGAFFSAPEVMTALSFLRVIDNPLREVELTAVMLSPLYGFTPDDCARVRLAAPDAPLYTALQTMAGADDAEDDLPLRCAALLTALRRARTLAVSMPVDRLLERLYRDTGMTAVYAARTGGRRRVANLHRLDSLARGFEQGEFRGCSAFVRYIDRLQEQGKDIPGGAALQADSVRIMTVHGSKGLEFPVVFLARLGGKNNTDDSRKRLLFHHEAGIGLSLCDPQAQERHRPLPLAGVLTARQTDDCAEELRIWYVALTRAREKLCFVLTEKDLQKRLSGLEMLLPAGREIPPDTLLHAVSPADWMLLAALRHPSFAPLRTAPEAIASMTAEEEFSVRVLSAADAAAPDAAVAETDAAQAPDPALTDTLAARIAYRYPYTALAAIPAKLAASALSHTAMQRDHIATARPAFFREDGLTAAQKGTALHTFMQFADFAAAASDPLAEARRLTAAGFLTERQRDALPEDKIRRFFVSELFARMTASPDCRREFAFTVEVPAAAVVGDGAFADAPLDGETVVVQGIADCVFVEGDGLVLVDYKTDRVHEPQELIDRYRSQLTFYRRALEPIFGMPVRQALLYSFALGEAVLVA